MLANMVDNLTIHVEDTNAIVVYFFCRYDISRSFEERTVIGALGRQILRTIPDLSGLTVADKTHLSSDDVIPLLKQAAPSSSRIYIVLDGLDLCARPDRDQISTALNTFQQVWKASICISYRSEPDVTTDIPQLLNTINVPQPDNKPDIEVFIEAELDRYINSGVLVLGNPGLKHEIQDALIKGSHGKFLWVTLQIYSVCSTMTDEEVREALENLPQDLTQIYNQILERTLLPGQAYRANIFKFVLVAKRPTTIHEMREALSVTPGDTDWNPSKLLNDVYQPLKACGCLIVVEEEELTIQTVHPSVDMFILTGEFEAHNPSRYLAISMNDAHTLMLSIFIT
ncbi:hypothetical protein TUN199_07906 [Pyrenophora tritici-repentis]|nr:hypothetical protein Alg130_02119 [Pyrenophora tritici-repentis]KAI0613581.1 hypothetical protein TUN205_02191 [Pyrenophora tritici-repentis]KAI0620089.1 hypothetical protein TUN199_07906 [Pyrenophora tritici-repentis]